MTDSSKYDEEIIELTQIIDGEKKDLRTEDAFLDTPESVQSDVVSGNGSSLSLEGIQPELLEKTLEKWVEKEFGEKIQPLLRKVVERVVEREMRRIQLSIERNMDKIQKISREKI